MKITDSIKIDWHHDVPKKTTSCVLTVSKTNFIDEESEFTAIARVHEGDSFSRKEGRKRSLTRVLKNSGVTKDVRTEIWSVIWSKGVKI